jgi:hypothetical protein
MKQTSWMLLTGGEYVIAPTYIYITNTFKFKFYYLALYAIILIYNYIPMYHIVCGTLFLVIILYRLWHVLSFLCICTRWNRWNEINDYDDDNPSSGQNRGLQKKLNTTCKQNVLQQMNENNKKLQTNTHTELGVGGALKSLLHVWDCNVSTTGPAAR